MSEAAKHRWKILFNTLMNRKIEPSQYSVRRFHSFGLFFRSPSVISESEEVNNEEKWFLYTSPILSKLNLYIRYVGTGLALDKLRGFNNTGNVCVWPSEEVLAYYCAKHSFMFENKKVCELGGGMTCLAGLAISVSCSAKEILLTDGNEYSLQNIEHIIRRNSSSFQAMQVHSRLLRWENDSNFKDLEGHFDFIICADCLFFESSQEHLLDVILKILKCGGQAMMFAPRRRTTFHKFVDTLRGAMELEVIENYDENLWEVHNKNMREGVDRYDEDIHYPLMLVLRKTQDNSSRKISNDDRSG